MDSARVFSLPLSDYTVGLTYSLAGASVKSNYPQICADTTVGCYTSDYSAFVLNGATYTPQTALTLAYTGRDGAQQDWTGEAPLAWDCPAYTVT